MYSEFLRNRLSQLRISKGVSEYQMSLDLGHSRGYIQNISSGKCLPSLEGFFEICDYFGLTPAQFFDAGLDDPVHISEALKGLQMLDDSDRLLILNHINRLARG